MHGVIAPPSKPIVASAPTPDQLAALDRLVATESLVRAPRVHNVLRYMVDALIAGHPETVNEQHIGEEVFRRPPGYSPSEDNIVRVTVSNLRTRLDDFYRNQGKDEAWVLEIPKGKYVPHLRLREQPVPVKTEPVITTFQRTFPRWILPAWVASIVVAVLVTYGLRPGQPSRETGFLQQFLGDRHIATSIVLADGNLQAYRNIYQKTVPLQAYVDRSYLHEVTPEGGIWNFLSSHNDTTVTSALLVGRMQRALNPLALTVRHPQDLSLRDLQKDTLILLGGPWINPWGQLFEGHLAFQIVAQQQNRAASEIRNLSPRPGEPDRFVPHTEDGFRVSYSRIAVLPNLTKTGHVILVGSNTSDAMEAAGDFLVSPYGIADLLKNFHCSQVSQLPAFEVMLEVRGVSNTPNSVRVIAHRTVTP